MKIAKLIIILFAAALVVSAGCERKVTETVVVEEQSNCFACHSDQDFALVAAKVQWETSTHATGGNFERNSSSCSRCHTNEGFNAYIATGSGGSPTHPSPVGCFTCHAPHTKGDLSLRVSTPVTFERGGTFDRGSANLCANCHEARTPDPDITGATVAISQRWGPHHAGQANVLTGQGAYTFGTAYESGAHSNVPNGCITCHMAAPYGNQAGGHTFAMSYLYHDEEENLVAGCETEGCHTSVEDFSYEGVQATVQGLLDDLKDDLIVANLLTLYGSDYYPATATVSADEAKAVYNYLLMEEEGSLGLHNPDYVIDVLNASIAALGAGGTAANGGPIAAH
jgi:formate-dependent nitrite reductase cytochrome c552 subunit